jgi:ATP-dependent helicase/nuclease subunit A
MNDKQQTASDPNYSIWVSASAGTGKTKILTDRVLKLLINGVEFQKILCLTFTNAAANEMQNRIYQNLATWAESSIDDLQKQLYLMIGDKPSYKKVEYAKSLYLKLVNGQDKINIYTIHSFCQKILKCFPFESNINPGFQILDDIKLKEIIKKIRMQIYHDNEHEEIINFFLQNFHETTIDEILNEIIKKKLKFKKLLPNSFSYNLSFFRKLQNFEEYIQPLIILDKCPHTLSKIQQDIRAFFLTQDSKKKKRISLDKRDPANPELLSELANIRDKIFKADQSYKLEHMKNYSNLLIELAQIFIDKYDQHKSLHSLLDYDDLIYFTKVLLTSSDSKDWVLYKLDGGIDHLLVDEAQDTSTEQWEIIQSIIAEFHSGESNSNNNRTIFVVGDDKQSIFSFQGANIDYFTLVNYEISNKFLDANKNFKIVELEWSYRSTQEILDAVYQVFEKIKSNKPELFTSNNPKILSYRSGHKGIVELWPLVIESKRTHLFWDLPNNISTLSPEQQLAEKIARFIKHQISNKVILPSTGKPATEADFMILVRTRKELSIEIINQLKQHSLNVAGIDRMILSKNLSVMDLISAGKFVVSPNDDLNLASLLKSPLIGLDDELIQYLALSKGSDSIWQLICNHYDRPSIASIINDQLEYAYSILNTLMLLHKVSNVQEFFARIVDCLNLRDILLASNGLDSGDAINEFLYLSYTYNSTINSSLQSFIYWFENNENEVKRDAELLSNIRVMTVHSSKGLQAPVVILADTTSLPDNKDKLIWIKDGNNLLSSMNSSVAPQMFLDAKQQQEQDDMKEYIRLLYVAMTRAQDHLVICGYSNRETVPADCWYDLVSSVINTSGSETGAEAEKNRQMASDFGLHMPYNATASFPDDDSNFQEMASVIVNQWHPDPKIIARLASADLQNSNAISPLVPRPSHLEYGNIFHRILEDAMKAKNIHNLKNHPLISTLSPSLQAKILKNIDNLLQNREFLALSSFEIKTELNLGVDEDNWVQIGRIDLLAISDYKVTIIDYKSDLNPAETKESVPPHYLEQLSFYTKIVQKLYPNKEVIRMILWLENGCFMSI